MLFLVTITSTIAFTAIGSVYSYWMDRLNQVEVAYPQAIFYATENSDLNSNDIYKDKDYKERVDLLEVLLAKDKISYNKVEGKLKL